MIRVKVNARGRVECVARVELPMGAARAWGELRDLRRFASKDLFHTDVRIIGGAVRGAALDIPHRFGPFRAERAGRVLWWAEGRGYAFSDLSRRDPHRAFPHVYRYELSPLNQQSCRLDIAIRGRWTTQWLARPLVRLWLLWVFSHIVRSVENDMLAVCCGANAAVKQNAPAGAPGT